jgi:hypothetical protein
MTRSELVQAERMLRKDDPALRLRFSMTEPVVFIERKTFRGQIGHESPIGPWEPDTGRRREEGHVLVGTIYREVFNASDLRDSLRAADSWRKWDRNAKRVWQMVEAQDHDNKVRTKVERMDNLRYKASELFDRYVWKYKQRVSVPTEIK